MRDRLLYGFLLVLGVSAVVYGYRLGTVTGLALMAIGVLPLWLVAHMTAWSIPTITDVRNRPREAGIDVPADLREYDPDIVHDRRFWGTFDTPSAPRPHPDDPGRSH